MYDFMQLIYRLLFYLRQLPFFHLKCPGIQFYAPDSTKILQSERYGGIIVTICPATSFHYPGGAIKPTAGLSSMLILSTRSERAIVSCSRYYLFKFNADNSKGQTGITK